MLSPRPIPALALGVTQNLNVFLEQFSGQVNRCSELTSEWTNQWGQANPVTGILMAGTDPRRDGWALAY